MSEGTTRGEAAAHILAREVGRRTRSIQSRIDAIEAERLAEIAAVRERLLATDAADDRQDALIGDLRTDLATTGRTLGRAAEEQRLILALTTDGLAEIDARLRANEATDQAQDSQLGQLDLRVTDVEALAPVSGPKGDKGDKGETGAPGRPGRSSIGGGGAATIQAAGVTVGTRPTLNFVSGATVTDNAVSDRVDVTVSGGGGGVTSLAGSNGITVSAATGAVTAGATFAAPASLAVSSTVVTGSASSFANSAHVHAMPGSAVAGASAVADSAAAGSASTLALSDHKHSREAFGTTITASTIGGTAAAGTSTTIVREDHKHAFPAGAAPTALTVSSTQATGSSASPALADHVHAMPGSGTPGASAVADSAATGSATTVALSDHKHGREAFATPVALSGAVDAGSATTVARSDHQHGGAVVFPLGTALLPSIAPASDADTGLWSPAADTLALSTGALERVRIDSIGAVGIGTTSPISTLDVRGIIRASQIVRGTPVAGSSITFGAVTANNLVPPPMFQGGTGALTSVGTTATGSGATGVAADPTGRFLFVTNYSDNTVQAYTINQSTGAVTSVGAVATGTNPHGHAVDPTGRFVFVANNSGNTVQAYTINQSTGALTSVGAVAAGNNPIAPAADPTGRFVYVSNNGAATVQAYTINQSTGALTSVGAVAAGTQPIGAAVDPTGRFLFVTNYGSSTVQAYTINQSTGAVTSVGTTATGSYPHDAAVDPTGRFAFVVNIGSDTIQAYTINQFTGALTSVGAVATGSSPFNVAVDPTGRFVFVSNFGSNTVQAYRIDNFGGNTGTFLDRLMVGTIASPAYALQLSTDSAGKPTSSTWTVVSDARLKDVAGVYERGLADVVALAPKRYRLNGKYGSVDDGREHVSVIAQEVQTVWPEMIGSHPFQETDSETGESVEIELLNLNTNDLQWGVVNAIKELLARIEHLTARLGVLEDAGVTLPT